MIIFLLFILVIWKLPGFIGKFMYRTGTREADRNRRVTAKAEYNGKGPNYRYVVTSLPSDGRHLY